MFFLFGIMLNFTDNKKCYCVSVSQTSSAFKRIFFQSLSVSKHATDLQNTRDTQTPCFPIMGELTNRFFRPKTAMVITSKSKREFVSITGVKFGFVLNFTQSVTEYCSGTWAGNEDDFVIGKTVYEWTGTAKKLITFGSEKLN